MSQSLSYVYIFSLLYMSSTLCLQLWRIILLLFNALLYNEEQWEASKTNKGKNSYKCVQETNELLIRQDTIHNIQTQIIYSLQVVK